MAYASNILIKRGDIICSSTTGQLYETNISTNNFSSLNNNERAITNITGPGIYPSTNAFVLISPNGKYLAVSGTTSYAGTNHQRILLINLETGVLSDLIGSNINISRMVFTPDSKKIVVATSVTPFILIYDVETGTVLSNPSGTYTFTSGQARFAVSDSYFKMTNFSSTAATPSIIYSYNYVDNSITTWESPGIPLSAIGYDSNNGDFYAVRGTTGVATPNILCYSGEVTTPVKYFTNNLFASAMDIIAYKGFVALINSASNNIHMFLKSTGDVIAQSLSIVGASPIYACRYAFKEDYFIINRGSFTGSIATNTLSYIYLGDYVSGLVTDTLFPSVPQNVGSFAISPGFKKNKVSGFVYDKNGIGVPRKISVFIGNYCIATGVSNATTGKFSIPLMTDAEVRIVITGDGTETTQLLDKIVPVDINATDCAI